MSAKTIVHLLENNAKTIGDKPAYFERKNGQWNATSWDGYYQQSRQAGRALLALGLDEGDITTVLGSNRSEWTISLLGSLMIGGISAGIYTSNSPQEVAYIVNHSESKVLFVENNAQLDKVNKVWADLGSLEHVVMMRGSDVPADDDRVLGWDEFLAKGDATPQEEVDKRMASLRPDQVADFIYTSGTTGPPKAVMLTHENLTWTAQTLGDVVNLNPADVALSYLPLSHIAEQANSVHIHITKGYKVYFCDNPLQLADYIKEVRPTTFFGVPRVWERFYSGISANMSQATGIKASIASWATGVGTQVTALRNQGKEPSGLLALQNNLADKLVFSKLREAIGFDRCRIFITGAAPAPRPVLDFFASVGITLLEIYGQSEGTGPTSTNLPGKAKFGTVGPALPGVDVKIGDDGEILFKGKNVFAGYYKNESATNETLIDGWLHSGDLGEFDSDGFLSITGRKKDIIITSGGKNIAPKNLEGAMTSLELVSSAVCVGEQQRYLIGLLTLEPEAASRFASANNIPEGELHNHPKLRERLAADITEGVNSHFARVEHIRNFVVLPSDFSVETGELTPTFKIKRAVVNKMYESEIAAVYEDGQLM
ncbi:MAG: long-chain fatty acid--CoA ligase [Anaerolineae bacterium]